MRTRCVGHACLEIEAAGLRFVTDPWWAGPAYAGQLLPWPSPQPAGLEARPVDYVFLSCDAQDHFHLPTLRRLRPGATALVPELLSRRISRELRDEIGFCRVIEMRHGRRITLRRGVTATCWVNVDRAMLVIEDGDRVLVDANGALHESPTAVIDYFCKLLRDHHPSADVMFLGHRSGSWFPNCVRVPGKDDRLVARHREEMLLDNFLRVVDRVRPRLACAFAGSFVLSEPHNRWINDVRFDVPTPDVEHARRGKPAGTRCHLLLPNDVIDGVEVIQSTTPRPSREELHRAYSSSLREGCEKAQHLRPLTPDDLRDLVARLDARIRVHRRRLGRVRPFTVEIGLRENPGTWLHLEVGPEDARAALGPARDAGLRLELRAEVLDAVLREPAGTQAVTVGYGAVASLCGQDRIEDLRTCLRLLGGETAGVRHAVDLLRQGPLSAVSTLWRQRWPLTLYLGTRLGLLGHPWELRSLDGLPALREAA